MWTGLLTVVIVLTITAVAGVVYRRRSGVLRVQPAPVGEPDDHRLTADELGAPLGSTATLVHFSSAFCQPCRATRGVLGRAADTVDGVAHVEVDAEANLELVRRLKIMRTPTVLVLDPYGRIVRRASGQPRLADVVAVLGAVRA
ncbi:MAG TPA: thioredoxin family protein [Actinomycetes bacterium]|nr:thioredoxin family protein [Actinomycetes bacterium]